MKAQSIGLVLLSLALIGCAQLTAPTPVEVTRVIELEVTVPVEVTRELEVTRLVQTEVTRQVTRQVTVVVTSVVEKLVRVTAEPTAQATSTTTSQPAATSGPSGANASALLQAMQTMQQNLQVYAGYIDAALRGDYVPCSETVSLYDSVAAAPTFNTASSSQLVRGANSAYESARGIFLTGTRDMTQNCRDFLASQSSGGTIPFQQWGLARQQVNAALQVLEPAIRSLGGE